MATRKNFKKTGKKESSQKEVLRNERLFGEGKKEKLLNY